MKNQILKTLSAIQSVNPIGSLVIFAGAYLASYIGLAALLIVGAFLVGLHLSKRPALAVVAPAADKPAPFESTLIVPAQPAASPIGDAIANGLQISKIEFKTPTPARIKKAASSAA